MVKDFLVKKQKYEENVRKHKRKKNKFVIVIDRVRLESK